MTRYLARDYFGVYTPNEHKADGDIWLVPGKSYFTYHYDADNRLTGIDIRQEKELPPQAKTYSHVPSGNQGKKGHKEGEMLVKFKADVSQTAMDQVNAKHGTGLVKMIPQIGVYKVKLPAGVTAEEMAGRYRLEPEVEYAEPNYMMYAVVTPNDPQFFQQWGLNNTGQSGGTPDADIDAPEGWDVTTGQTSTVMAVVDTGCDLNHPDLQGKFIAGHDFINDDSDPWDDNGHGTYVAGILGASTNNTVGGAGVLWQNQIMPLKVLGSDGSGSYEDVVSAILYAADNGVDVVNMSLGGSDPSDTLLDAMEYAYNAGVVLVSAAGNDNGGVLYPAAYTQFGIAVAATDHNDQRASFSNYGSEVDVAAPGVNIYSTWWDDTYSSASGTSAATPFVSGLAGLLLSQDPALLPAEVEAKLKSTSEDVNIATYPGNDVYLGAGRINAHQAVIQPLIPPAEVQATVAYEYDKNGNQTKMTVDQNGVKKVTAFEYDYENRLTRITYPDTTTSEYSYDGGGRRMRGIEEAVITKYFYDGLNVILERDWNNVTQVRYTRGAGYGGGIGGIISEERRSQNSNNSVTRYYHYDGIGTVTGLSNPLGYLTESFTYDAFGNMLGARNEFRDAATGGYRFSTKESNAKSGLVYFGARYYDPRIGRFITPDPLTWGPDDERLFRNNFGNSITVIQSSILNSRGKIESDINDVHKEIRQVIRIIILQYGKMLPQITSNRYVYCGNNPVNYIDAYGYWREWVSGILNVLGLIVGILGVLTFFSGILGGVGVVVIAGVTFTGTGLAVIGATLYALGLVVSAGNWQSIVVGGLSVLTAFLPGLGAAIVSLLEAALAWHLSTL
jgi:RHS repeat-associated protein